LLITAPYIPTNHLDSGAGEFRRRRRTTFGADAVENLVSSPPNFISAAATILFAAVAARSACILAKTAFELTAIQIKYNN